MNKKQLTIIIVTFNSEKYICRCLKSIIDNLPNFCVTQIVIIDNNSRDSTVEIVKKNQKKYSNITLISKNKNLGFAKAVNIGIKKFNKSDYFLFLNPDTIVDHSSIENLIYCLQKNQAGIASGNTYTQSGNQNGSYFRFPNLFIGLFDFTNLRKLTNDYWHKYFYYLDKKLDKATDSSVDVVTGGYMLVKKEVIGEIGYLDERFFMYLEDVDFCLRAKNVGIKTFHCNKAKIIHHGGRSSNNKDRIRHSAWLWSRKLYFLKHFNFLSNIIIQPIFLIDDAYILISKLIK